MKLAVDLHSHSGYAGGVGDVPLDAVVATMHRKGIQVFGAGDCLFPARTDFLRENLREHATGLFRLPDSDRDFLLQTEVILSVSLPGYKHRIVAHHLILFPDFASILKMQSLMSRWGMKNTIGRPFITCREPAELEARLFEISALHPLLEVIPAHVMTPDGIFGSKNGLSALAEFYGTYLPQIRVIETGLSADPDMLAGIPDLAALTFISNSDVHSAALNRIGREFTVLEVETPDYPGIITALREGRVDFTAEFVPAEGRYYLTGHRANRPGHAAAFHFDATPSPEPDCPVCGKTLPLGVRDRCRELTRANTPRQPRRFRHLVPLVEVVAHSLGVSSVESTKVKQLTLTIIDRFGNELNLWDASCEQLKELLDKRVPLETFKQILAVHAGRFGFDPPGFDGNYGVLRIESL